MTTAADLLRRHFETLLADNARWQTLIADDVVWEPVYAPSLGHPARLSGREEVVRHVTWFLGAVENLGVTARPLMRNSFVRGKLHAWGW